MNHLEKIIVTVNGTELQLDNNATIAELLESLKIVTPAIAIELNRQIVSQNEFESHTLSQGDVLEIVTLVGGG